MSKRLIILLSMVFLVNLALFSSQLFHVEKVDFLSHVGLEVNGAGPLLVQSDPERGRIVLVNTNTSSVSIIEKSNKNNPVINIPFKSRVPQYLKSAAMAINPTNGNIYIIGNHSLHIVFPKERKSLSLDTGEQYEMVAVNRDNGDAFLVGRGSQFMAFVQLKNSKIKKVKWVDRIEKMANLNQTPPPPIRKVVCDAGLQKVMVTDGFTSDLYIFSANTGKLQKKRKLKIKGGKRWHYAGYNTESHHLYVVIETAQRKVAEALKIDVLRGKDQVVPLPGLSEGVGINYNSKTDEIYIPYDNAPTAHLVDFKNGGKVHEIKIPAFGNDATAIDQEKGLLYIASWAYGTVEVIDIKNKKLKKTIKNVGIIPHMFNMAFNPADGSLYIPLGASAVNGSFGAALTVMDPSSEKKHKVYTGWAPVELISLPGKENFLVFNSEDEFAEVEPNGNATYHKLPYDYPHDAVHSLEGNICLAYGPHQSYWPVVYIWAAKNGILRINTKDLNMYDRRIPRLAHRLARDNKGVLYALQNNWGDEKQFLAVLPDEVRAPNQGDMRLELDDRVLRETTQRILKYDEEKNWLYVVKVGELDNEPGILQVLDLETKKVLFKYPTDLTPTDLVFDSTHIYIANFDSNSITIIDKKDFTVQKKKTGNKPLKLALADGTLYCINHQDNTLQLFGKTEQTSRLPLEGRPGNIKKVGDFLYITSHQSESLNILGFSLKKKAFLIIHTEKYPFGETTLDTDNSAFYLRGQFGDSLFEINRIKGDKQGRTWITDYLSGKLFIISRNIR